MLFGSKESPTPARPLVEGTMKLRGRVILHQSGGFGGDLEGDLHAESSVQILPEALIHGNLTSGDEVVLHAGSLVRGTLAARALDLQAGSDYTGFVRVGPESLEKTP
jgi:cytoskeletal protein CcmA (bactofilin family)